MATNVITGTAGIGPSSKIRIQADLDEVFRQRMMAATRVEEAQQIREWYEAETQRLYARGQIQQSVYPPAQISPDTMQHSPMVSVESRVTELEEFLKYAADASSEFGKLLAGWRARKRLGIGEG